MNDWIPLVIGGLGLLGGVMVAFINRNASPYAELARRVVQLEKSDEEKSDRIDALEDQIDTLKRADGSWRTRVKRLLEHIDYLYAYITVHGQSDAPRPDELPDDLRML